MDKQVFVFKSLDEITAEVVEEIKLAAEGRELEVTIRFPSISKLALADLKHFFAERRIKAKFSKV